MIKKRDQESFTEWRKEEWPNKITWDSFLPLVGCQDSHCAKSVVVLAGMLGIQTKAHGTRIVFSSLCPRFSLGFVSSLNFLPAGLWALSPACFLSPVH